MKKIIIILTLFSIILFPIKSFADLVGKKVLCDKLMDGGVDGFEFLEDNYLAYYEFSLKDEYLKSEPSWDIPVKYPGVAFWPVAKYEEEPKKIIINFNHYLAMHKQKILNRKTLELSNPRFLDMTDPSTPTIRVEELGVCEIVDSNYNLDANFKNIADRYLKWLEKQLNENKL